MDLTKSTIKIAIFSLILLAGFFVVHNSYATIAGQVIHDADSGAVNASHVDIQRLGTGLSGIMDGYSVYMRSDSTYNSGCRGKLTAYSSSTYTNEQTGNGLGEWATEQHTNIPSEYSNWYYFSTSSPITLNSAWWYVLGISCGGQNMRFGGSNSETAYGTSNEDARIGTLADIAFVIHEAGNTYPTAELEFPQDNNTIQNDFSAFRVNITEGNTSGIYSYEIQYYKNDNSTPIYSHTLTNINLQDNGTVSTWLINKAYGSKGEWTTTGLLRNASGTVVDTEEITWIVLSSSTVTNTGVSPTGILTDDYISELFPDQTVNASGTVATGACAVQYECSTLDMGCSIGFAFKMGIAFAFCPNTFSTNMIKDAMADFSHTPPFNIVFDISDSVYNTIGSTATTTAGTLTLDLNILQTNSTSTIQLELNPDFEQSVGTNIKDAIFDLETALIWLAAAYKAIRMLTMT